LPCRFIGLLGCHTLLELLYVVVDHPVERRSTDADRICHLSTRTAASHRLAAPRPQRRLSINYRLLSLTHLTNLAPLTDLTELLSHALSVSYLRQFVQSKTFRQQARTVKYLLLDERSGDSQTSKKYLRVRSVTGASSRCPSRGALPLGGLVASFALSVIDFLGTNREPDHPPPPAELGFSGGGCADLGRFRVVSGRGG
jgi:hypothetical protein